MGPEARPVVVEAVKKALFFAALAVVAVLSLLPAADLPDPGISDKLSHFLVYGALAVLGRAAYLRAPWAPILIGLVLYGVLMEGLQGFVPSRTVSGLDALANALGVMSGYALIVLTGRVRRLASK